MAYNPPTFIASYSSTYVNNSRPKTVSITTQAGDYVVVCAASENGVDGYFTTPTGNSISFTRKEAIDLGAAWSDAAIWWGLDSAGGTGWTLSLDRTSGTEYFGMTCYVFRDATGVDASSQANVSGAAPSLDLTTQQDNSAIVVMNADWNTVNGASRTWRSVGSCTPSSGNGMEQLYSTGGGAYGIYTAYYDDAGTAGSKTVGLSAPAGQKYSIVAIEVKGAEDLTPRSRSQSLCH